MNPIIQKKNNLLDDLWLPTIKRAGSIFYPRLKRNKQMKLLTLTSDENFKEISDLISEKITEKALVYPWNCEFLRAVRLETEGWDNVLRATRYEDSIMSVSHDIQNYFPFSILNLDFCSQGPIQQVGRFEKEIMSLDKTLSLQRSTATAKSGFVLIYTTIMNGEAINCATLRENSTRISAERWTGISLSENAEVVDLGKKIQILKTITEQFASKYCYDIEIKEKVCEIENGTKLICSFACIFRSKSN